MVKKLLIILVSIVVSIPLLFILPWVLLGVGLFMLPNPPKPAITYKEFPFRIEYVQNSQHKVLANTLICQFDGIGLNEAQGKYRQWKGHFANNKNEITWKLDENTEYSFSYNAEYLMDYDTYTARHDNEGPNVRIKHLVRRNEYMSWISYDELRVRLTAAKIRIIDFEYPQPIHNTFQ